MPLVFIFPQKVHAATSPTLGADLSGFSVLGGSSVTCNGATTTTGGVGVSPGTSITGFPTPCVTLGGTHSNDAAAIAAQADNLSAFGTINQTCDQTFGAVDLSATFPSGVGPGVYCSTSSFTLTGNLNLTGSGVWIFKTVSTIITSPGSSVTGGDPCNVWWRVGSAATLDTTTSFIGNILALSGIQMNTGSTLNGRALVQSAGAVTLDSNTITGPICVTPTPTPTLTPTPTVTSTITPTPTAGSSSSSSSSSNESTSTPTSSTKNTSPKLPNTGFAPHKNSSQQFPRFILLGILVLLALILTKHRFLSSHENLP